MKNFKVTEFKILDTLCAVDDRFSVSCKINGILTYAHMEAWFSYISHGATCNTLRVNDRHVQLASTEQNRIQAWSISESEISSAKNPKQKDFSFTGPIYKKAIVASILKDKLKALLAKPELLSETFRTTF